MEDQYDERSKKIISNSIKILRFPLLLMIVLIHCNLINKIEKADGNFILAEKFIYFVSEALCSVAVPTYFLMSGFLFFGIGFNGSFTFNNYIKKLKSRFYRLMIPYILWNFIGFLLWTLYMKSPLKAYFPGLDIKINFYYFLSCFWSVSNLPGFFSPAGVPVDVPMWFIRDLIIMSVISPLIYFLLKHLKYWPLLIIASLFVLGYWPHIVGFSIIAIFFFSFGAYCSIYHLGTNYINKIWILFAALCLMITETCIYPLYYQYIHSLSIIAGVMACIYVAVRLSQNGKLVKKMDSLGNLGFFIFAFHMLFGAQTNTLIVRVFSPDTNIMWLLCYISSFLILITLSSLAYYFLQKISPTLLSLLTGTYKPKKLIQKNTMDM